MESRNFVAFAPLVVDADVLVVLFAPHAFVLDVPHADVFVPDFEPLDFVVVLTELDLVEVLAFVQFGQAEFFVINNILLF